MSFTEQQVADVWGKAKYVSEENERGGFRKDTCSAWIKRNEYGNRKSSWGWEIDHINPNGGDGLDNLRPLHWENNVAKSDGRLVCAVTANGNTNAAAA
jgi:hypothetical protein